MTQVTLMIDPRVASAHRVRTKQRFLELSAIVLRIRTSLRLVGARRFCDCRLSLLDSILYDLVPHDLTLQAESGGA